MLVIENGARVTTVLPGKGKGMSTKRYVVLGTDNMLKHSMVVKPIRTAVSKGYPVLHYNFVTACLEAGKPVDEHLHALDVTKISSGVTKDVSLERRHFSQQKAFLTTIKQARRKRKKGGSTQ